MGVKLQNANEIVVVDDDELERVLFERYLKKSKLPNNLLAFESGERLLEYLRQVESNAERMPALVVVDARMPTMDGYETIAATRAIPACRSLPMVIFSNSKSEADVRKSQEVGADHFQEKPPNGDAFVSFLNSLA